MHGLTTGIRNVAIGKHAMNAGNGNYNIAIGDQSLYNSAASNCTAVGYKTLMALTTGGDNTAVGMEAIKNQRTTGEQNTAVGR